MSAADLPRMPVVAPPEGHLPLPLLQEYAAGTLSAGEQHRVEAHTLECGRCADILDGLLVSDASTTEQAVAGLRRRLQTQVGEPESVAQTRWPWRPMAAAAALVLMLSTAFWFGVHQRQPEIATVPAITKIRPIAPEAALPAAVLAEQAVASAPLAAPRRLQKVQLVEQSLRSAKPIAASHRRVVAATNAGEGNAATLDDTGRPELVVAAETPVLARSSATPNADTQPLSKPDLVAEATRLVRGRITDTQGQPLPGATVQAAGAAASTATAADGTFALRVPKPVTQVHVSSIGFLARQQPLNRDTTTQLTLALVPDSQQLNEVVIVRREKAPAPVAVDALPAGGYPAFKQYLKDSLDYPPKALESRKEGTVQLSFTVAADGTLQDIKVVRRVSEEIDAEATRLLREGPKWFPAIRNGRRVAHPVRISIPFVLEDHL